MDESRDRQPTDDVFERRLRGLLADELEAAERDFVAPTLDRRGRRTGIRATVLLAAAAVTISAAFLVVLGQLGFGRPTPSAGTAATAEPTQAAAEPSPTPTPSPSPTEQAPGDAPAWPGAVVASFDSVPDTMSYDRDRGVIWLPVVDTVGRDYLYRFEPASRSVARWELPETTYRGVMAQVIVDDSGAVWVSHHGYRLDRFDPDRETVASIEFPLEIPGTDWANGGTWISAIAADGDGVLVARSQVPYLVRVGPSMTVTATIDLPTGFEEATGLALVEDHIFITKRSNGTVARLSLDGGLEEHFAVTADRLAPFGDGVVATYFWTGPHGAARALGPNGSVLATIPPPFSLPPVRMTIRGPTGAPAHVTVYPTPSAIVDDGAGKFWYLVNNEPVLRQYEGSSTGVFQPLGGGDGVIVPVGSPVPASDTPCPNGQPCGP